MRRAEQFEHAPGAGAEIEQRADRRVGRAPSRIAVLDRRVGDVQRADAVPFGGVRGGNRPARLPRARRARRRAARGRARASDRRDRAGRSSVARQSARAAALAQAEERPRRPRGSARPARPRPGACRWREMRGCDWRRMSVRSETVSSASASSARMRSRVASPAALSAPVSISKRQVGANLMLRDTGSSAYKDIFIRLSWGLSTGWQPDSCAPSVGGRVVAANASVLAAAVHDGLGSAGSRRVDHFQNRRPWSE